MSQPAAAEERTARSHYRYIIHSISDEPTSESPYATGYRREPVYVGLHNADPPPKYATSLCSAAFLLKLTQLALTTAAAALLAEGKDLLQVETSNTLVFPHIAYTAYIVIPSIIVLSYLLGQKMHELLIRLVLALGVVMHAAAAACAVADVWRQWGAGRPRLGRALWLGEALLALAAAAAQAADLAASVARSYRRAASHNTIAPC